MPRARRDRIAPTGHLRASAYMADSGHPQPAKCGGSRRQLAGYTVVRKGPGDLAREDSQPNLSPAVRHGIPTALVPLNQGVKGSIDPGADADKLVQRFPCVHEADLAPSD